LLLSSFSALTLRRWQPFDPARNFPDLGPRFKAGEDIARANLRREKAALLAAQSQTQTQTKTKPAASEPIPSELPEGKYPHGAADPEDDDLAADKTDLDWSAVLKRTFEAYIRGERPNMYGEWIEWRIQEKADGR
jgi:WD repeat and SOF domain-containing protein 1